eukprot:scaffold189231_cov31-Tisochrysis_lutea.AAC.2
MRMMFAEIHSLVICTGRWSGRSAAPTHVCFTSRVMARGVVAISIAPSPPQNRVAIARSTQPIMVGSGRIGTIVNPSTTTTDATPQRRRNRA